jgi:hypothetical protein
MEAGTAELVLLHHGGGEAELGSADGAHVPTHATAEKDDIKAARHRLGSIFSRT